MSEMLDDSLKDGIGLIGLRISNCDEENNLDVVLFCCLDIDFPIPFYLSTAAAIVMLGGSALGAYL